MARAEALQERLPEASCQRFAIWLTTTSSEIRERPKRSRGANARAVRGRATPHVGLNPAPATNTLHPMGSLTFALNVTLDGCIDHRAGVVDDALHRFWTRQMDAAGAMLFGRTTYELMEAAWPAVARDKKAPVALRDWAKKLEAKPKYVVSTTRREFPWANTHLVEGDLAKAIRALKKATPRGVLVGSPALATTLVRLGLVDEIRLLVHPVVAGHGPYLFAGLEPPRKLKLAATRRLASGHLLLRYRGA